MTISIDKIYDFNEDSALWVPLEDSWDPIEEAGEEYSRPDPFEFQCNIVGNEPKEKPVAVQPAKGFEVGDDRVDIATNKRVLEQELYAQEAVLQMKTSEEDTFISDTYWNFCETTSIVPHTRYSHMEYARKTGTLSNLDFCDVPPLRIILDVRKEVMDHSSTVAGKMSMLGSRIRTPNPKNSVCLQQASWLQDSSLLTTCAEEPKYLHKIFGGSGAPDLFGDPRNTFLYMRMYKKGDYTRLYASAINEVRLAMERWETVGSPGDILLAPRLRTRHEYLHGTYAEKVSIPPLQGLLGSGGKPVEPLYNVVSSRNLFSSAERRLVSSKRLIGRTGATVEFGRKERLDRLLYGTSNHEKATLSIRRKRGEDSKEYGHAIRANAAYNNLVKRIASGHEVGQLQKAGWLVSVAGVKELTQELINWQSRERHDVFTLDDMNLTEEMYLFDEVSAQADMKVSGICIHPATSRGLKAVETTRQLGKWQVNEEMDQWAERLTDALKSSRDLYGKLEFRHIEPIYNSNREWISDDTQLIAECAKDTRNLGRCGVYLVSGDRRLANQMSISCNVTVVRIDPRSVIRSGLRPSYSSSTVFTVDEIGHIIAPNQVQYLPPEIYKVYVDYGSLQTYAIRTEQSVKSNTIYDVTLSSGNNVRRSERTEKVLLRKLPRAPAKCEIHTGGDRFRARPVKGDTRRAMSMNPLFTA